MSYCFSRRCADSMTLLGVAGVFLLNTSTITTASASTRYTTLQVAPSSLILNSWHLLPIVGIGRDAGSSARHLVADAEAEIPPPAAPPPKTEATSPARAATRAACPMDSPCYCMSELTCRQPPLGAFAGPAATTSRPLWLTNRRLLEGSHGGEGVRANVVLDEAGPRQRATTAREARTLCAYGNIGFRGAARAT
jgi:hypothetical protein